MRQIVLDTETTGLDPAQGHRIIEIGGVELLDRCPTGQRFHRYLCPDRTIDADATKVHGLTKKFLDDKPRFADIAEELLNFLRGAELIIHNAPFDVGFLDAEWQRWATAVGRTAPCVAELCQVTDTLVLARQLHPGLRNNLDALCKRYAIDNTQRDRHGALLDAELLVAVYLAMTRGQDSLTLDTAQSENKPSIPTPLLSSSSIRPPLRIIPATAAELLAHQQRLAQLQNNGGCCVWFNGSAVN